MGNDSTFITIEQTPNPHLHDIPENNAGSIHPVAHGTEQVE